MRDVIKLNVSEVPYVRYLIGRIVKTYDYINRVVLTLLLSVYEGTWTHSPLLLLCITMILCVRRKIFEITTFPNRRLFGVPNVNTDMTRSLEMIET